MARFTGPMNHNHQYPGAHWRKPKSDLRGRRTSYLLTDGTVSASKDGLAASVYQSAAHTTNFSTSAEPYIPTFLHQGQARRTGSISAGQLPLRGSFTTYIRVKPRDTSGSAIEKYRRSGILHKAIPRSTALASQCLR